MSEAKELAARLRSQCDRPPNTATACMWDAATLLERQAERIEALEAAWETARAAARTLARAGLEYELLGYFTASAECLDLAAELDSLTVVTLALLAPAPGKETTT